MQNIRPKNYSFGKGINSVSPGTVAKRLSFPIRFGLLKSLLRGGNKIPTTKFAVFERILLKPKLSIGGSSKFNRRARSPVGIWNGLKFGPQSYIHLTNKLRLLGHVLVETKCFTCLQMNFKKRRGCYRYETGDLLKKALPAINFIFVHLLRQWQSWLG